MAIIQQIKLKETNWGDEANSLNTNFEQLNLNKAEVGQEITPELGGSEIPSAELKTYTYTNPQGIEETYTFRVGQTAIFQDDRGRSLYAFKGLEGDNAIWERVNDNGDAETTKKLFTAINLTLAGEVTGTVKTDLSKNVSINTTVQPMDASKIISGVFDLDRIPKGAIERMVVVPNKAARFALTLEEVQNGDTVKEVDTKLMYYVVDNTKLSTEEGYEVYQAGRAAACPWTGVEGKPTTIAGYGITDAYTKSETEQKFLPVVFPGAQGKFIQVGETNRDILDTVNYHNNDIYPQGNTVYGGVSISNMRYIQNGDNGYNSEEASRVLFMYTNMDDITKQRVNITRLANYTPNQWASLDIYADWVNKEIELYFCRRTSVGTPLLKDKFKVWHQGNDGPDSGLDADTLDGKHASSFVPYYSTAIPNDKGTGQMGFAQEGSAGSIVSGGPFLSFGRREFSQSAEIFQLQSDLVNKKTYIRYITGDVIGPWTELATLDSNGKVPKAIAADNADTLDNFHAIGFGTNNLLRRCTVYSDQTLSSYWVKVASVSFTEINQSRWALFNVVYGFNNLEDSKMMGILKAHVSHGASLDIHLISLNWLVNTGIDINNFRLYYNDNGDFELWCNTTNTHNSIQLSILNEGTRINDLGTYWNLYNTKFTTVQTPTLPSYITPTLSELKNPSAGGSGGGVVDFPWLNILTGGTGTLTEGQFSKWQEAYTKGITTVKDSQGIIGNVTFMTSNVATINMNVPTGAGDVALFSSYIVIDINTKGFTVTPNQVDIKASGNGNLVLRDNGQYENTFLDASGWLEFAGSSSSQVLTLATYEISEIKSASRKGTALIKSKDGYWIPAIIYIEGDQIGIVSNFNTVGSEAGNDTGIDTIFIQINGAGTTNNTTIWRSSLLFKKGGTGTKVLADNGQYIDIPTPITNWSDLNNTITYSNEFNILDEGYTDQNFSSLLFNYRWRKGTSRAINYINFYNGSNANNALAILQALRVNAANGFFKESDIRLKSNIREIELSLEDLIKIPTAQFKMNGKEQIGTIAQEIEKICPQIVDDSYMPLSSLPKDRTWETKKEGEEILAKVKSVEYEMLGVLSLHGVKLLAQENKELKQEVNSLKLEIKELQEKLNIILNLIGG